MRTLAQLELAVIALLRHHKDGLTSSEITRQLADVEANVIHVLLKYQGEGRARMDVDGRWVLTPDL